MKKNGIIIFRADTVTEGQLNFLLEHLPLNKSEIIREAIALYWEKQSRDILYSKGEVSLW